MSQFRCLLGCWAALSFVAAASGHASSVLRKLSNRFAEGGFMARIFFYVFSRFGRRWCAYAWFPELIDLLSTFCRHASSTVKSASDILIKVHQLCATDDDMPPQESSSLTNESSGVTSQETVSTFVDNSYNHAGQPALLQRIVSSISEGDNIIKQWKDGKTQFSLDVPSNMSTITAVALKQNFNSVGADHLLQGANIKAILEKALVCAKSERDKAILAFEDLQKLLQDSPSADR